MPDQPADPINYEMKIPPEPKDKNAEEHESAKKQGDKINTGNEPANSDTPRPNQEQKQGGA